MSTEKTEKIDLLIRADFGRTNPICVKGSDRNYWQVADCRAIPTILSSLQICITEKITEDSPGYTVARYITVTDSASKLGDDGGNWEAILDGNLTYSHYSGQVPA